MERVRRSPSQNPLDCATLLETRSAHASDKNQWLRLFVMATQTAAPSGLGSRGPRSLTEDRLQIGKYLGKIQVGLCAHTEVAAGMGIHRDDRLYPSLKIAAHPDHARRYRAGRPSRARPL